MTRTSIGCCSVNGLEEMFGPRTAQLDVQAYTKLGLRGISKEILDFLQEQGLGGKNLLDIGCGAGALLLELLKAGADRGVGVDASLAYIQAAEVLAEKKQMQDRVSFRQMDFVQEAERVAPSDIVLMQRVVCCYPKMRELVVPAAQHARHFLALVYPRDTWWMKLGASFLNLGMVIIRCEFRFFIHPPPEILALVLDKGFIQVYGHLAGPWQVAIFQRQA